ncbi:MAG TPA: hypothetical protein VFM88_15070 [Vicinamibacteria bacterium]|nr:hypothetical protein [Vicinamibacteria bacterium]
MQKPVFPALVVAALALLGCPDLHLEGPEDPTPVDIPARATVTIEYEQPPGCISTTVNCQDLVIFLGSWMPPGGQIFLAPDAQRRFWTARITGVPVNYPPRGKPYEVRIYDPHLQESSAIRYTGRRLRVGSETLTQLSLPGSRDEAALVYVDATGVGHNPS